MYTVPYALQEGFQIHSPSKYNGEHNLLVMNLVQMKYKWDPTLY